MTHTLIIYYDTKQVSVLKAHTQTHTWKDLNFKISKPGNPQTFFVCCEMKSINDHCVEAV